VAKEILCGFGVDVDAVAGWLGSYGGPGCRMSAIREAQDAVQGMLDILDQGRAARGMPAIYTKPAELGARAPGGILLPRQ
jgi:hypothetical protein